MPAFPSISRPLLLSLLAHGLVLAWYGVTAMGQPASPPASFLHAHLSAASPVEPDTAVPLPSPRLLTPEPAPPVRVPMPVASPVSPAVSATPLPSAASAPVSLALAVTQDGLDAGSLRSYRLALAVAVRRSGGLMQNLKPDMHGRVELALTLSSQGQVIAVAVQQGSGNSALDRLAVMAMSTAGQQVALPASLLGRSFSVVLPLEVD